MNIVQLSDIKKVFENYGWKFEYNIYSNKIHIESPKFYFEDEPYIINDNVPAYELNFIINTHGTNLNTIAQGVVRMLVKRNRKVVSHMPAWF